METVLSHKVLRRTVQKLFCSVLLAQARETKQLLEEERRQEMLQQRVGGDALAKGLKPHEASTVNACDDACLCLLSLSHCSVPCMRTPPASSSSILPPGCSRLQWNDSVLLPHCKHSPAASDMTLSNTLLPCDINPRDLRVTHRHSRTASLASPTSSPLPVPLRVESLLLNQPENLRVSATNSKEEMRMQSIILQRVQISSQNSTGAHSYACNTWYHGNKNKLLWLLVGQTVMH
eukprot:1150684-Pelagomonas_calceolata.AAC.3